MSTDPAMTGIVRLAEIRSAALSVDEMIAAVSGASVGGVVVFLGTVRDNDHERSVTRLDYSAHPSAAEHLLRVVREVGEDAPGVALAAVHRVGELQVGEIAVIVAAGCPHRDEAFRVGRLLIDRIKAEVPLWKRQRFTDGDQEWVGVCD